MNVLIADDDADSRLAARLILEGEGYQISEFEEGSSAQKAIQESLWDVVLLDLRMPGTNGIDVLRTCHARLENALIIVITAEPHMANTSEVEQYANFVLQKPYDIHMLLKLVKRFSASRQVLP